MKAIKSIRMSGINIVIYLILTILSVSVLSQLWKLTDNILLKPKELNELNIDKPVLRPYHDVFFYLDPEMLKNEQSSYQKVQRSSLILKTIIGVVSGILFIVLILQLKKVFFSLQNKTLFTMKNLYNVRNIACLLGIWVMLDFILYQLIQIFIPLELVQENINYIPLNEGFFSSLILSINYGLLLAAFSFYVIFVAFKKGIELKEESDLTI